MSKQHKAKPLKLVDTPKEFDFQRVTDIAREVQAETRPGKGADLANALEIARLQTEVADLREQLNWWKTNFYAGNVEQISPGEPCPACGFFVPDGELAIDDVTAQMLEYTKTEQAQRWARAWKAAAKVNRQIVNDQAKLIKRRTGW